MLKQTISKGVERLLKELRGGALWFIFANVLPPMVAIVIGPIILKKAGLEQFGLLGLAGYFLGLLLVYSDFGTYSHLLAIFHRHESNRFKELGNAMVLKVSTILLGLAIFGGYLSLHPRTDGFNAVLGASLLGLFFPAVLLEWFFITRRRYFHLFLSRAIMTVLQASLTLVWYFSPTRSVVWVAFIGSFASVIGSMVYLFILGRARIRIALQAIRESSLREIGGLAVRLLPIAATQFLTPYFLVYSLPWFSHATDDKRLVGAFSVSYRIISGLLTLVGPFVLYALPAKSEASKPPGFLRMLTLSTTATAVFWALGFALIWFYFQLSKADPIYFLFSIRTFSVLLVGVFAVCLRTPYVGRALVAGRYKTYFLLHSVCLPVLLLSWLPGRPIPSIAVPFFACLPDVLATSGFILVFSRRGNPGTMESVSSP